MSVQIWLLRCEYDSGFRYIDTLVLSALYVRAAAFECPICGRRMYREAVVSPIEEPADG